jgi:hypothetical protein
VFGHDKRSDAPPAACPEPPFAFIDESGGDPVSAVFGVHCEAVHVPAPPVEGGDQRADHSAVAFGDKQGFRFDSNSHRFRIIRDAWNGFGSPKREHRIDVSFGCDSDRREGHGGSVSPPTKLKQGDCDGDEA